MRLTLFTRVRIRVQFAGHGLGRRRTRYESARSFAGNEKTRSAVTYGRLAAECTGIARKYRRINSQQNTLIRTGSHGAAATASHLRFVPRKLLAADTASVPSSRRGRSHYLDELRPTSEAQRL